MPFIGPELRQALGLMTSCPSQEDIDAAAAARGLQLRDGVLVPAGPADNSSLQGLSFAEAKASRAKRTAAVKALQQLSPDLNQR